LEKSSFFKKARRIKIKAWYITHKSDLLDLEENIEIAQLLFEENKYHETIYTCNQILTTDNNSIEALKLIAKSFLATRRIDDARLYFNKALTLNLNDHEAIKDLGNTYQSVGDSDTAKKDYKEAIEIKLNYAPALTNLGCIEVSTGKKMKGYYYSSRQ